MMTTANFPRVGLALALMGICAFAALESVAVPGPGPETGPLAAAEAIGVKNAHVPAEGLLTAGQLTEEQMSALQELGYRTFISLRPATEPGSGWEEDWSKTHDIDFIRIPVKGAEGVNRENTERLAAALGPEGNVVYCASGNRVGALLALKAYLLDHRGAEEALAFGKKAGLTRLEPTVREALGLERTDD